MRLVSIATIFSYSDLDLVHIHLGSNPNLRLVYNILCLNISLIYIDVSNQYTKFGVNRPKQTKVIERKLNFYFELQCH